MPIVAKSSHRFIIIFEVAGNSYKLFQIMFSKKDGSLHVNFPYYKHRHGLATLAKVVGEPDSLNLGEGGKATSHRVKYSHHVDGRAHFSQDGKVRSSLKKMALPLKNMNGHIFTVQLQGLADFANWNRRVKTGPNVPTYVQLQEEKEMPPALKFVGWWYWRGDFVSPGPTVTVGPVINCRKGDGTTVPGLLLAPPPNNPNRETILVLTYEPRSRITKAQSSILSFLGGFDAPNIVDDLSKETSFLSLIYPVPEDKHLSLVEKLGTIDYVPAKH